MYIALQVLRTSIRFIEWVCVCVCMCVCVWLVGTYDLYIEYLHSQNHMSLDRSVAHVFSIYNKVIENLYKNRRYIWSRPYDRLHPHMKNTDCNCAMHSKSTSLPHFYFFVSSHFLVGCSVGWLFFFSLFSFRLFHVTPAPFSLYPSHAGRFTYI